MKVRHANGLSAAGKTITPSLCANIDPTVVEKEHLGAGDDMHFNWDARSKRWYLSFIKRKLDEKKKR